MRKLVGYVLAVLLVFGAGVAVGQKTAAPRKTLLHSFSFKTVAGATPAQLDELWAATRKLASQSPEIKQIWMGKIVGHSSDWQYNIVMEFDDAAGHDKYAKSPAHDEWLKTYSKVREEGTFTIDTQSQ